MRREQRAGAMEIGEGLVRARPPFRAAAEIARRPHVGLQRDEAGCVQHIGIAAFAQRRPGRAVQQDDGRMLRRAIPRHAQPRRDGEGAGDGDVVEGGHPAIGPVPYP